MIENSDHTSSSFWMCHSKTISFILLCTFSNSASFH